MDSPPPPPPDADSPPPPPPPPPSSGSPTDFLKGVVGKRVIVRLISGVDYRGQYSHRLSWAAFLDYYFLVGVLSCLDGYMNIALEQTEEHVNGAVTNRYGDAFIRGNNGKCISGCFSPLPILLPTISLQVVPWFLYNFYLFYNTNFSS
jgi:U6 snRNA-associated Sm-like protein LSm6